MKTQLTVDRAGRVVLPMPVRRQFHLDSGAILEMTLGSDSIVLKPQDQSPVLVEQGGLLVHKGAARGDLTRAVENVRRRRDSSSAGVFG